MSNRNQYSELWQQKRNELPVGTDMQTDWSEMQNLLDRQMPVQENAVNNAGSGSTGTYLSHLTRLKLLFITAGLVIVGAAVYFALAPKVAQPIAQNKVKLKKDSVLTSQLPKTDGTQANNAETIVNARSQPAAETTITADADKTANNHFKETEKVNGAEIHEPLSQSAFKHSSTTFIAKAAHPSTGKNNRSAKAPNTIGQGQVIDHIRPGHNTGRRPAGYNRLNDDGKTTDYFTQDKQPARNILIPDVNTTQTLLNWDDIAAGISRPPAKLDNPFNAATRALSAQKGKSAKQSYTSNLDWGLLIGANTSGSFTAKAQNHNIYGSLPVDIFVGTFANYNFSEHWAVGLQGKVLVPHTVRGNYSHTHWVLIDTPKNTRVPETLQISDTRKVYTIDVPLHLIYKVSPGFNIKAGPTISIPVKETNGSGTFYTKTVLDSPAYYHGVTNSLKATKAEKKIRYGASAGLGVNLGRVALDATYNYNFQKQKVSSALGSYSANTNSVQFTIGIKLNKQKN